MIREGSHKTKCPECGSADAVNEWRIERGTTFDGIRCDDCGHEGMQVTTAAERRDDANDAAIRARKLAGWMARNGGGR